MLSQSGRATPTIPPGLEPQQPLSGLGAQIGTGKTGGAPPGLSGLGAVGPAAKVASAVPADVAEDVAATIAGTPGTGAAGGSTGTLSRPGSRMGLRRQITPVALPLRPGTPKREVSVAGKKDKEEVETPTKKPVEREVAKPAVPDVKAKENAKVESKEAKAPVAAEKAKAVATPTKVKEAEKTPAAPATPVLEKKVVQPKSQVQDAKASPASKSQAQDAKASPGPKSQAQDAKATSVPSSKIESAKGRKHPGKLDITAAVEKTTQAKAGAAENATPTATVQTPSKLESPAVASPAVKTAPRTLRVVQAPTPKTETPPASAVPTEKPKDAVPAAVRQPSRQPSVASISHLPGTPSSEQVSISDNISLTSASQSRANSPPPSARTVDGVASTVVGSAPVRQKTKSQVKKDRQERAKQIDEERAKIKVEEEEAAEQAPQQEAIVARKKKAKKDKPAPPPKPPAQNKGKEKEEAKTRDGTPVASRAASPTGPKDEKLATPTKPSTPIRAPVHAGPTHEPSPPPTPTLTAAQIIAEIKATAPEIQKSIESLLRASPTSSNAFKPSQPMTAKDIANADATWKSDLRFQLSKDDIDGLLRGTLAAKHLGGKDGRAWSKAMVSPSGATLRALSQELEARFLELEKALRELPDELRFRPTKPQNETKFPHLDLEALKRELENSLAAPGGVAGRGNSAMEQMVHDGSGTKRGAFLLDEVGKYINEFVMPPATPPPQHAQPVQTQQQATQAARAEYFEHGAAAGGGVSVDVAERQLAEARRVCEEREGALRKVVRRNKKILGLG